VKWGVMLELYTEAKSVCVRRCRATRNAKVIGSGLSKCG
jgi:hypothetical protein